MTSDQRLIIVGIYLNSALYCLIVFVAGILTGQPIVWKLAAVTVGLCSISYLFQLLQTALPMLGLMAAYVIVLSWGSGILAGLILLVHA